MQEVNSARKVVCPVEGEWVGWRHEKRGAK
jgi:hypothetical protein